MAAALSAPVLAFGLVTRVDAAPIPLGLTTSFPDIVASSIALSYNAGTDALSATSVAPLVYLPGNRNIIGSSYALNAVIDAAGNLVGAGTLVLSGTLTGAGSPPAGPLSLTANLTQFGYNPGGTAILEFLGTVTAQNNAGFTVGSPFGVILNSGITNISFASSFTQTAGSSENFSVSTIPEPSTLSLLALGAFGLGAARRRSVG